VVAIGSSSTRGVGASSWAATFPEVMKAELERLQPGLTVELTNAGRNGETAYGQLARLDSDAMALGPTLVIWQLGSNDVVMPWGGIGADLEPKVIEAVKAMRAGGADVILMDLQNSPMVAASRLHREMISLTERAARAGGAGYFRRFELLERAVRAGVPLSELTSWDQLHNTDAAYDCVGRALARAIRAAAR
jgi:lysophospholipase L1-like esterase